MCVRLHPCTCTHGQHASICARVHACARAPTKAVLLGASAKFMHMSIHMSTGGLHYAWMHLGVVVRGHGYIVMALYSYGPI